MSSEIFLHGVEVIEIDNGTRPIRTVRSSVIGLIGTAPDSAPATKATLSVGAPSLNTGLTLTAKNAGAAGNSLAYHPRNPGAVNRPLTVTVGPNGSGKLITVSLATNSAGAITSTAADVKAAIEAHAVASTLVDVTHIGSSTGAGIVSFVPRRLSLTGGSDEAFPLNTPRLIAGDRREAARLGARGTLPTAIDGIFDYSGAVVIVVRVEEGFDELDTMNNIIGGVNVTTGAYEGVLSFLSAESEVGFTPRILIAPGFTHQRPDGYANPVVAELLGIAQRLRAVILADGPNTNDADAIRYRGDWGSKRVYVVDPWVKVMRDGELLDEPPSARVAGVIARTDNELGFWWSPSNKDIGNGIVGTARKIDFALGDSSCRANLLNENEVATIIRKDGFRLWGNRTCADDPKWAFLSVVRTNDMVAESILQGHMWAVDRNITKTFIEEVVAGVNAYLSRLQAQEAILGGECYAPKEFNRPEEIADGKVTFEYRFTPPYPAEHIIFRAQLVNDYLEELF